MWPLWHHIYKIWKTKDFVESTEPDAFFFLDSSYQFQLLMEITSMSLTCQLAQALSAFFSVHNWRLINGDLSIPLLIYNKQPFQVWFEDDCNDDDDEDDYDDDDYDDDDYDDDYDGDDGHCWRPPLPSTSHK